MKDTILRYRIKALWFITVYVSPPLRVELFKQTIILYIAYFYSFIYHFLEKMCADEKMSVLELKVLIEL